MLPALAVTTPTWISLAGARAIAFRAPRILNELIGWRVSSLSQISPGPSCHRTSGVRTAKPASRSRAERMSSRVGAFTRELTTTRLDRCGRIVERELDLLA